MHVCSESRAVTCSSYKDVFTNKERNTCVWMDFETDVLFMDDLVTGLYTQSHFPERTAMDLARVKNLAIYDMQGPWWPIVKELNYREEIWCEELNHCEDVETLVMGCDYGCEEEGADGLVFMELDVDNIAAAMVEYTREDGETVNDDQRGWGKFCNGPGTAERSI